MLGHVGGGLRVFPARHLRREIRGRARQEAGRGDGHIADRAGDAEVGDLHRAVVADQQVRRFHVSVHDARVVCGSQCARRLGADPRDLGGRQGALAGQFRRQARRVHVFHDQPGLAVFFRDIEDGDRVRMMQPGGDPALAHRPQPRLHGGRPGQAGREQQLLDRDGAPQANVRAAPDHTHGTGADRIRDPIPSRDQPIRGHGVVPLLLARRPRMADISAHVREIRTFRVIQHSARKRKSSKILRAEVFCTRIQQDEGIRRLLRMQLQRFRRSHTYTSTLGFS
jgi:hypothetical protein